MSGVLLRLLLLGALLCGYGAVRGAEIEFVPVVPEEDEVLMAGDFMAVVSMYGPVAGYVERNQIRVYFDREDITALCDITDRYIRFVPDPAFMKQPGMEGKHFLAVIILDRQGNPYRENVIDFRLTLDPRAYKRAQELADAELVQRGNVALEYRMDELAGFGRNEFNTRVNWSAYKGKLGVSYGMYLTSDEDPLQQPRSTFRLETTYDRYFKFGLGDFYPNLHKFVATGTRVRGISLNTRMYNRGMQTLDLDVVYGLSRMGSGNLGFTADGIDKAGVYKRRTLIINPKFGSGKRAQVGFIISKSKDDFGSIEAAVNDSGQLLNAPAPKDNLVLGANFLLALWRRRVVFDANWAFGIYTDDIRNGPLTPDEAENFGVTNLPDLFERHKGKIIVNSTSSFLIPTSDAFRNSSVYDVGLRLTTPAAAFDNYFDVRYKLLGPKYRSYTAPYLGASRRGVRLLDRFRFLDRTVTLSGMLGLYRNNIDGLDDRTTAFTNWSVSAQYLPRNGLPDLRLSYADNGSDNGASADSLRYESGTASTGFSAGYALETGSLRNRLQFSLTNSGYASTVGTTAVSSDSRNTGISLRTTYGGSPVYTVLSYGTSSYDGYSSGGNDVIGAGIGARRRGRTGLSAALHTSYSRYDDGDRINTRLSGSYVFTGGSAFDLEGAVTSYGGSPGYRLDARYNRLFNTAK